MYESETHDVILKRMLGRVSDNLDKREGNLIYTCLSSVAEEMASFYADIDYTQQQMSPLTADPDNLEKWGKTFSITRLPATNAILTAEIKMEQGFECPIGTRFNQMSSQGGLNFVVIEKTDNPEQFLLQCEQSGEAGNEAFGQILPIMTLPGLISARIINVAIRGEDQEADDNLRQRISDYFSEKAFGGNMADYMQKLSLMRGVGGAKLVRYFNETDYNIGVYITGSDYQAASEELLQQVQEDLLPILPDYEQPTIENSGDGLAPISHVPIVMSATEVDINITLHLELSTTTTFEQLREKIEQAIQSYLTEECNKKWAKEDYLYVRVSYIENAVLAIDGVLDCYDTEVNGEASNFRLSENEITKLGTVTDGGAKER